MTQILGSPRTGGNSRLLLLDALRLAAALAVVLFHYTSRKSSAWDQPTSDVFPFVSDLTVLGAFGVQLFFVISGFVILMSAWGRTVGNFTASRIARLFPAYWASVALFALLFFVIASGQLKEVTWMDTLVNLTMFQEGFGVKHMDGVYWTLWVELLFYVLVGLLLWTGLTYGRVLAFATLWPVAAVIADRAEAPFLSVVLIPDYAPLFAGGMVLYLIHAFGHSLLRWLLVVGNAFMAAHQTTGVPLEKYERITGLQIAPEAVWLLVLGFFALVALFTVSPLRYRGAAWMATAGALTYPLYLVHEWWGWWMIGLVHPVAGKWVAVAAAIGFSLGLAWLIHRFVERPLARPLRTAILKGLEDPTRRQDSPNGPLPATTLPPNR